MPQCEHPNYAYIEEGALQDDITKVIHWSNKGLEMITPGYTEEQINSLWWDGQVVCKKTQIPCGKCDACRMNYQLNIAKKVECEAKAHPNNNWFITLTYDNEHLPIINTEDRSVTTLRKEDARKFIKDLREYQRYRYNNKMKYLLGAEYGELKARPHYHTILMNGILNELKIVGYDNYNEPIYSSEELEKIWKRGKVDVRKANPQNIAYTAMYCQKKIHKTQDELKEKEFVIMSRNLGIDYLKENYEELTKTDELHLHGTIQRMPTNFIRYIENQDHEKAYEIKQKRQKEITPGLKILEEKEYEQAPLRVIEEKIRKAKIKHKKSGY